MKKLLLSLLMASAVVADATAASQLAFPGAQGWGRFATGGRTGSVYHVTNLNDSGTGSLRDAVSSPNRIVVFDVAGVINIKSRIVFSKNLYVAGQTAPGEGITVYGDGVSFSGATNTIVRYMRFRMGHGGSSGKDCAGVANGTNMIFDHCSFAWGLDEVFSINADGKGDLHSFTISNCIIGQGLMTHSAGGLMQADSITLYRNLYCDNSTRNNKVKGINQYANCIVYNWKNAAYIMGGDSEGSSYCNIESNLFINGPAVGGAAFTGANSNFHCYGNDNWQDRNMDGVLDPSEVTDYSASDRVSTKYNYPELELWAGNILIDSLLPTVGASLPYRDYTDCYMIDEVKSFGTSGALISNEENLVYGAPSTWTVWGGNSRVDSDGDGIPDEWEARLGTDPNKDDAMTIAANGYTNIENYINGITADDVDYFLRAPMCTELEKATTTTLKIAWRDYTSNEDGFIIELKGSDGNFTELARTGENETSYTLSGLEPATDYVVRLRAFDGENYSDYTSEYTFTTRPLEAGIIDIDTYEPDYTWNSEIAAWDYTTSKWNDGTVAFQDNGKTLFAPEGDATVTLDETVTPASVVVNGEGNLVISGSGVIAGDTVSVNKGGSGTLTLNTANTYGGATVLHDGTIEFNTLKNGGVASAIGASKNFAQNWVMDGGTYKYTGSTTSTDRSAKLTNPTVFEIANSGATVTMSGAIEGTSDFILDGEGTLKVANTGWAAYSGSTTLRGGNLSLSTVDITKAFNDAVSKVIMEGGQLTTSGETNGYETYSFPMEVVEGTTSQFSPARLCYINNKVTGAGTLQINIPYLREYIGSGFADFEGRIIANGVSSDSWGSLFLLNKSTTDLSKCVVETKGNAKVCSWATNGDIQLGGLAGASGTYLMGSSKNTKGFTCKWTVGSANTDETFAGIINNNACAKGYEGTVSIVKVGTGEWRLTGKNVYSGTTQVKGGTLIVNGTNNGTGKVTVTGGSMLKGKGTIAGAVTVGSESIVHAGDTLINAHTLTLSGGLTVLSGGIVEMPLFSDGTNAKANKIKCTGTMKLNDGAVLQLDMSEVQTIKDDQVFQILDVSGTTFDGEFTSILPEKPSDTQEWDTSKLYTNGLIYVRASTDGIRDINADADKAAPKYNMQGQRISKAGEKQIYIQNGKKLIEN